MFNLGDKCSYNLLKGLYQSAKVRKIIKNVEL